jgi:hypothetical protein
MMKSVECESRGKQEQDGDGIRWGQSLPLNDSVRLTDCAVFCQQQVEEKLRECNDRNRAMQDISIDEPPSDRNMSQVRSTI